jgi:neutral ceramidase
MNTNGHAYERSAGFSPLHLTESTRSCALKRTKVRAPREVGDFSQSVFIRVHSWLIPLALLFAAISPSRAGELRIGAAAANISPPIGTPLAGYYYQRPCDGVLDDLYAKAAVLDDGRTRAALVVCDLVTLPRRIVLEARKLIAERTGIPGANVMIAATHSHTGPVLVRDSALDEVTGANSPLCRKYNEALPKRIAQAVADASAKLAPTRVSYARAEEHRIAFNRRYWMKDGTVGWNPGKLNPNIMRPAGPIDPEVGVVYFESADAKPQFTFVNFSMHPDTTGGTWASADYPGALARRLADYKGPDMLTIFANGACGNINHINVHWAAPQSSTNEANRLGIILASDVLDAYTKLKPVADTTLRVRSETLRIPLAKITDADVTRAQAVAKLGGKAKFLERVEAYKVLDVAQQNGKPWEVEVQVFTLGKDLAWVSMPGELFVEPGLNLKAVSPFKQTAIVELANGSIGYIPNRPAYAEGNYEVASARCAEGTAELLITTAVKLLERLHQ